VQILLKSWELRHGAADNIVLEAGVSADDTIKRRKKIAPSRPTSIGIDKNLPA